MKQFLDSLKSFAALIGAGIVGVLVLLLKRKDAQLQVAKVEIQKRDDDAKVEPLKTQIAQVEQKVELDAKSAEEAEARLRASLNAHPLPPKSPGGNA